MTTPDYTAAIAKGVALLDAQCPGWLDRIDLDRAVLMPAQEVSRG